MTRPAAQPRPITFHLAVGAAALCLIAVAVIILRAVTTDPRAARGEDEASFVAGRDEGLLGQDAGARGLQIQVMDRDDRDRLSAEFRSDTIDPLQAQRYAVTHPEATFYLQDGRIVHVRALEGTLVMPDRTKTPETGTLRRDVVVRLFELPEGGDAIDLRRDEPTVTWTGSSLTFDATLGEASTNEPFVLTSPGYEFRARDAKLLINQALERLELLTVRQGGTLVATQIDSPEALQAAPSPDEQAEPVPVAGATAGDAPAAALGAADSPTETVAAGAGGDQAEAAPEPEPAPVTTYYQAVMRGDVRLERAGQHVASDRLDLFARTIDNRLPAGAIAELRVEDSDPAPPPSAESAPAAGPEEAAGAGDPTPRPETVADADEVPAAEAAATEPAASPAAEADPDTAVLTWSGLLEIRPLATEPPDLARDHLLARFTAEESGVVSFADPASESSGQAAAVEYGFTTQNLVLSGPSQERSVFLTSPSLGKATMGRLELALATGDGLVPGPFSVDAAGGAGRLDCRVQTTLRFHTRDGRITGDLREAVFVGSVRASDDEASIESDFLQVFFEPDESGEAALRRLVARESVRLSDGQGNGGTCDELEVAFAPGEGEPTPTSFDARGNASFRDRTARIDAAHLYATLRGDDGAGLEVEKAWADGQVRFRRYADQIDIHGEQLFADLDAQLLEVEHEGGQATVARGPTAIAGESVRLSGLERTALVEGPGSFRHRAGKGETASSIDARWSEGMAFDDVAGRLEAAGAVHALSRPDPRTRETIDAAWLRVQLAPGSQAAEAPAALEGDDPTAALAAEDRQILTVHASGAAPDAVADGDGQTGGLATVESARFAAALPRQEPAPLPTTRPGTDAETTDEADAEAPAAEAPAPEMPALEQALRLSGVEIISDNQAGTIEVPGRGRLFVADLRPSEQTESETGEQSDQRGAALFDWTASFRADRAAGRAEMVGDVEMSHTNATDGTKAVLEAQRLRIRFAPGEGSEPESAFAGLRSAIAETEVYLRSHNRELTAATVEYDPEAGIARALADGPFGSVQVLDRQSGSPVTASAVVWNLMTDRVDIVDPSTVVIPR